MDDSGQRDAGKQYRIAGEDTPGWLTVAFAVIGTLIAAAAAWLWLSPASQMPGRESQAEAPMTAGTVSETSTPDLIMRSDQSGPGAAANSGQTEQAAVPADTAPPVAEPGSPRAQTPSDDWHATGEPGQAPPHASTDVFQDPGASAGAALPEVAASAVEAASTSGETAAEGEVCPDTVTIRFDYRSTVPIMAGVEDAFAELTKWLKEHPQRKVSVEGHADAVGSDQYNLILSYERAGEVARLLSEAGTAMERIIVVAAGSHDPIDGIPPEAGQNRRAIVELEHRTNCLQTPR